MNQSGDLGGGAPAPCHDDDVVFEVFETLVNAVDRGGLYHPAEPLRRIKFRAIRRQWHNPHTGGNAWILFLHVEAILVYNDEMQRLGVAFGNLP